MIQRAAIQRLLRLFPSRFITSESPNPQIKDIIVNTPLAVPKTAADDSCTQFVKWVVDETEHNSRLDRFMKRKAPGLPPGFIQRLIRQGKVKVDGLPPRRNAYPVSTNNIVEVPGDIKLGLSRGKKKPSPDDTTLKEAEIIRSWVLHREARCVVLNKPNGIATQGGTNIGERHVEAFLSGIGSGRYWLVHRLDKEVSGCLIVAKDVGAAGIIAEYFRKRQVKKTYWAMVQGEPLQPSGLITADVAGKPAITSYRVVKSLKGHGTWLELKPQTGRKHQLRVHCANVLGTPILGDDKYGSTTCTHFAPAGIDVDASGPRLHLHSRSVQFPQLTKVHASVHKAQDESVGSVIVDAPLPAHMQQYWESAGFLE